MASLNRLRSNIDAVTRGAAYSVGDLVGQCIERYYNFMRDAYLASRVQAPQISRIDVWYTDVTCSLRIEIIGSDVLSTDFGLSMYPYNGIPTEWSERGLAALVEATNREFAHRWYEDRHRGYDDGSIHRPGELAEQRAMSLLMSCLTARQRAQYRRENHFDVVGNETGRTYRINYGRQQNITCLATGAGLCFLPAPDENLPAGDCMLAQKIALECEENKVLKIARRGSDAAFPVFGRVTLFIGLWAVCTSMLQLLFMVFTS